MKESTRHSCLVFGAFAFALLIGVGIVTFLNRDADGWPRARNFVFFMGFSVYPRWEYGMMDSGGDVDGDGVNDFVVGLGEYSAADDHFGSSSVTVFSGANGEVLWTEFSNKEALGAAGVQLLGGRSDQFLVGSLWQLESGSPRVKFRTELRSGVYGELQSSREDRRASLDEAGKNLRPLFAVVPQFGTLSSRRVVLAEVRDASRSYRFGGLAIASLDDLQSDEWLSSPEVERNYITGVEVLGDQRLLIDANGSCLVLEDGSLRDIQATARESNLHIPALQEEGDADLSRLGYVRDSWFAVGDLDNDGLPEIVSTSFKHIRDSGGTPTREVIGWAELWTLRSDQPQLRFVIANWDRSRGDPKFFEAIPDIDNDGVRDLVVGYRHGLFLISGHSGSELGEIYPAESMSFYAATSIDDFNEDGVPDLAVCALDNSNGSPELAVERAAVLLYSINSLHAELLKVLPLPTRSSP